MSKQEKKIELQAKRKMLELEEIRISNILKSIDEELGKKKGIEESEPLFKDKEKTLKKLHDIQNDIKTKDSELSWLDVP